MPHEFSIEDLLKDMVRRRPEAFNPMLATVLHGWRLGALRECLVVLETKGITSFNGGDRWTLNAAYPDADTAMLAARNAGSTSTAVTDEGHSRAHDEGADLPRRAGIFAGECTPPAQLSGAIAS